MKWVALGAVPLLLLGLRLLRPWLETKGLMFPRGQSGSAGDALLHVHVMLDPSKEHVIEWKDEQRLRRDDDGTEAPPKGGRGQ